MKKIFTFIIFILLAGNILAQSQLDILEKKLSECVSKNNYYTGIDVLTKIKKYRNLDSYEYMAFSSFLHSTGQSVLDITNEYQQVCEPDDDASASSLIFRLAADQLMNEGAHQSSAIFAAKAIKYDEQLSDYESLKLDYYILSHVCMSMRTYGTAQKAIENGLRYTCQTLKIPKNGIKNDDYLAEFYYLQGLCYSYRQSLVTQETERLFIKAKQCGHPRAMKILYELKKKFKR